MSQLDKRALSIMENTIQLENGHYVMGLPWKDHLPCFPNNRALAENRLNGLNRKLIKDRALYDEYVKFIDNLEENSYAEKVPYDEVALDDWQGRVWYLPHHPVWHPQKKKIRVVFDCSATYNGISLNSKLLQGPDMTNSLVGVLFAFQTMLRSCVALAADIECMFYRVRVTPYQRDALRFLWWPSADLSRPPEVWRMSVHVFGAISSPSCCWFALRQTARDGADLYDSDVTNSLNVNFYMYDFLKSVYSVQDAKRFVGQMTSLLSMGGLRLSKWASNSIEVLREIPNDQRAETLKDLNYEVLPVERALGISWNMDSDAFCVRINVPDRHATRRVILSTVSAVYDPLGFVAPIVLPVKLALRDLCRIDTGWDEDLPVDVLKFWENWRQSITLLSGTNINRCIKPRGFGDAVEVTFHHFSDASCVGYSSVPMCV